MRNRNPTTQGESFVFLHRKLTSLSDVKVGACFVVFFYILRSFFFLFENLNLVLKLFVTQTFYFMSVLRCKYLRSPYLSQTFFISKIAAVPKVLILENYTLHIASLRRYPELPTIFLITEVGQCVSLNQNTYLGT